MQRRDFMLATAAAAAPWRALASWRPLLRSTEATLAVAGQAALPVWSYDGRVPGTTLRLRRGESIDFDFHNALPVASTIHWHGLRLPNAMDGVPHLTQDPVAPGARFHYRFEALDSGTFWYHPHLGTPEQVDRGLYGALIVEDDAPPSVDREWLWVLDDWRLDADGRIVDDFYDYMDVSHAGRLGRTLTINGQPPTAHPARSGERLRLRLVNAANARIFALRFGTAASWLIALDGHPLAQAVSLDGPLLIGPGMRADVVLDLAADAGRAEVVDVFGRARHVLATIEHTGSALTAANGRAAPVPPRANALPEPVLDGALSKPMRLGGGMMNMSGWPDDPWNERLARRLRRLGGAREADPVWTINGEAHMRHDASHAPAFEVDRGRSVVLRFENASAFWHPMHLHGHAFVELRRNRRDSRLRPWRDTTLLAPRDVVDVAFVAENPGDWLIHCHVLEHHAGGMGTFFRVRD